MAMTYLEIHCHGCKSSWKIGEGYNWNDDHLRSCPSCGATVDAQTWDNQIIPGFTQVADANRELERDHSGYGFPLFRISVKG